MEAISTEEARAHPRANQLSRYAGMEGQAQPGIYSHALNPGDRLLLCSDGLTGLVGDAYIEQLMSHEADPQRICQALVDMANKAGGQDNVSVIMIEILTLPGEGVQ